MLGCKYEERHNPNLGDLSYITDYSSSRQDVSTPISLPLLPLFLLVRGRTNLRIMTGVQ